MIKGTQSDVDSRVSSTTTDNAKEMETALNDFNIDGSQETWERRSSNILESVIDTDCMLSNEACEIMLRII